MLDLLNEIRVTGKISRAAGHAGMSYRHAWNLIEKWSAFFEAPLVERQQGRGTTLTPFGEKLVWAGQRLAGPPRTRSSRTSRRNWKPRSTSFCRAALGDPRPRQPRLRRLQTARDAQPRVRIWASTCATSAIRSPWYRWRTTSAIWPACTFRRGSCASGASPPRKGWLSPSVHRVIGLVTREMGLMVKRGNPLGIASLERLLDPAVRFVNRDPDSGTRLLFDQMLAQHGIDGARINGYEQIEFTHAAVAAYVASDMADVSFGVEAAARQFDLDFVRLVTEDYFFVCRKQLLELEVLQARPRHHARRGISSRHLPPARLSLPGCGHRSRPCAKSSSARPKQPGLQARALPYSTSRRLHAFSA